MTWKSDKLSTTLLWKRGNQKSWEKYYFVVWVREEKRRATDFPCIIKIIKNNYLVKKSESKYE